MLDFLFFVLAAGFVINVLSTQLPRAGLIAVTVIAVVTVTWRFTAIFRRMPSHSETWLIPFIYDNNHQKIITDGNFSRASIHVDTAVQRFQGERDRADGAESGGKLGLMETVADAAECSIFVLLGNLYRGGARPQKVSTGNLTTLRYLPSESIIWNVPALPEKLQRENRVLAHCVEFLEDFHLPLGMTMSYESDSDGNSLRYTRSLKFSSQTLRLTISIRRGAVTMGIPPVLRNLIEVSNEMQHSIESHNVEVSIDISVRYFSLLSREMESHLDWAGNFVDNLREFLEFQPAFKDRVSV